MEMIYIDSDHQARQTGVGAVFDTNAETWAAFRSAKRLEAPIEDAAFLLDYYNRRGDLADTIPISAASFRKITHQPVLTDAEYRELDAAFWRGVKAKIAIPTPEAT